MGVVNGVPVPRFCRGCGFQGTWEHQTDKDFKLGPKVVEKLYKCRVCGDVTYVPEMVEAVK